MGRSLPVMAGLGAGFAFLPRAWTGAWGALALAFAVTAAPVFADRLPAGSKDLACAIWLVAAVMVGLIAQGALYRLGVTKSSSEARRLGLGIGGLQFGLAELRLLGGGVFVGLFVAAIAGAFALVIAFFLSAEAAGLPTLPDLAAAAGRGEGWAIWPALIGVLAAVALIQVLVRLSLFRAATIARQRIVSVDALSLSHGAFWPLFAGLLVIAAPIILLCGWSCGLIGHGIVMPVSSTVYGLIRAAFLSLVELPFGVGFLSYAYNRLEYRTEG